MITDAVVIGGGIAGLAAAYELATREVPFALVEAADRLGGLIRTEHLDGFTIDCGADSMLVQKPAALALCSDLGLADRLIPTSPPRTAFVYAEGALHPLPSPSVFGVPTSDEAIKSFSLLPARARMELLGRLAESSPAPPALSSSSASSADESVATFFRREFGDETVELIAEPLLGGIHAGDVERLSILSVAPKLAAAARAAGGALRALRSSSTSSDPEGMFRALRGGMSELVSAIASRFPAGAVRLDTRAQHLTSIGNSFRIVTTRGILNARAVVIAAPAYVAADLLGSIDSRAAELCTTVPYVSTASVALAWRRSQVAHPLAGTGFVVARRRSHLRLSACTWVSSKWVDRAPGDHVLLRAFAGGAHDPDAVSLSDEDLTELAARELSLVLGITAAPRFGRVQRWTRAGAQHNVGHNARMAQLETRLAAVPGLFVAGSGFRSIGVPDCVEDGRSAGLAAADYVKIRS